MRSREETWKELSKIFHKYSNIEDPRGDQEFANNAGIPVEDVVYIRTQVGIMPPKERVYIAVRYIFENMTPGMRLHTLDLVGEIFKVRNNIRLPRMSDRMLPRSRVSN